MERLFIFADFNWLGKAELVGGHASQEVERSEGNDVCLKKMDSAAHPTWYFIGWRKT